MSDREKNMVYVLLVIGFLVVNAVALNMFFLPKLQEARKTEKEMKDLKRIAKEAIESQEDRQDEINWLEKSEKKLTKSPGDALKDLHELADREAKRRGLTVKRTNLQPAIDDSSLYYHRAAVELEVSGKEQTLYQWIDRMNAPSELRIATRLLIGPTKSDEALIDCTIMLEQWFVPKKEEAPESRT